MNLKLLENKIAASETGRKLNDTDIFFRVKELKWNRVFYCTRDHLSQQIRGLFFALYGGENFRIIRNEAPTSPSGTS